MLPSHTPYHAIALATQGVPPEAAQAVEAPRTGARLFPIVLVLLAVIVLSLWIGRRALRAAGIWGRARVKSAAEREEAFMAMTLALHEAARKKSERESGEAAAMDIAAGRESTPLPAFDSPVFCPACGAGLGATGPMLRFVTKCPGCARRLVARVEGLRVRVDVDVDVER